MRRKLIAIIVVVIVFTNIIVYSTAHDTPQSSIIGWDKCIGWEIKDNAGHTNGNTLYYKFDSNDQFLSETYKDYAKSGALKWSGTMTIDENDDCSIGLVSTYLDDTTYTSAFFQCYNRDSNNHLTSYVIKMNRSTNQMGGFPAEKNNSIMAHEYGHAIGLYDLEINVPISQALNADKLMFWSNSGWADRLPTTEDIFGAKVITGQHSTHYFEPFNHIYYNSSYHTNSCNACNGIKKNSDGSLSLEAHSMLSATCISPSRCADCVYTVGSPSGHNIQDATCEYPSYC